MINCDPKVLAANAVCFDSCIPPGMQLAVQTYLLSQILVALNPAASTDPKVLLTAATGSPNSFLRVEGAQQEIQAYLLCQIASILGA